MSAHYNVKELQKIVHKEEVILRNPQAYYNL